MLNNLKHVDILDTTLRDGSYTIGYQFTTNETALIAKGLELSGVNYIEVGHGLGLGADRAGKGSQAVSDLVYMRACANSLDKSKFGFFFIPGIGDLVDLNFLADEGGKFVRIGVGLESADKAFLFIEAAKKLGLEVWVNIMKTYAYPAKECKEWALRFVQAGADGVYIVDSAGGMLPTEVFQYTSELKDAFNKAAGNAKVGFHGHDNLSLSTACSLAAIQAGCDIVDGSLLGIGRSIGNAATEVLAMVLARAGYETGVNPWHAADLAENTIRPFLEQRWQHSILDQALGYAQIHSGFLPVLEKVSEKKKVGIRDIVLALGDSARRNITEEDATAAADYVIENTSQNRQASNIDPECSRNHNDFVGFLNTQLANLVEYVTEIRSQSLRMARPSAVVVTGPWREDVHNEIKLQQVRLLPNAVVGAIEVSNTADLEHVVSDIDGRVDILFLDKTPRSPQWDETINKLESRVWQSRIMPYADEVAGLIGACHVVAIESNKRGSVGVSIIGNDSRAQMMRQLLPYWGLNNFDHNHASILVLVGKFNNFEQIFNPNLSLIYDLMSGSINAKIAQDLIAKGVEVIRLDGRAALIGEVSGLLDAQKLADKVVGRTVMRGLSVVAGGVWGNPGDIVVNSIKEPSQVIGVADGNGGIKYNLNKKDITAIELMRSYFGEVVLNKIK